MQETPVRFLGWEDPTEKGIGYPLQYSWVSLMAQTAKNLPAMRETWVRSLGWKDPLEEEMATHSSLPGESPWTEVPGGLQPIGFRRVGHGWVIKHSTKSLISLVYWVYMRGKLSSLPLNWCFFPHPCLHPFPCPPHKTHTTPTHTHRVP